MFFFNIQPFKGWGPHAYMCIFWIKTYATLADVIILFIAWKTNKNTEKATGVVSQHCKG